MRVLRFTGDEIQLQLNGKAENAWKATLCEQTENGIVAAGPGVSIQPGEYRKITNDDPKIRFEWISDFAGHVNSQRTIEILADADDMVSSDNYVIRLTPEAIHDIRSIASDELSLRVVYFQDRFLKSTIPGRT